MWSIFGEAWGKVCSSLSFWLGETANEDFKLTQNTGDDLTTPTEAVTALSVELAEEKAKSVRLEQEYQKAKAEINSLVKAKRRLETGIRGAKELLRTQERDLGGVQAKVGWLEG